MLIILIEADTGRVLSRCEPIDHIVYDLRADWPRGTVRACEILSAERIAELAAANPGFDRETLVHPRFCEVRRRRRQPRVAEGHTSPEPRGDHTDNNSSFCSALPPPLRSKI